MTAWWTCGSKGVCRASIRRQWWRAKHVVQLLVHHLEAFQQRGGVGVLLGRLDRPLHVVHHRHQVAQQAQVGVAEPLFQFAGGPLAVVVQFGVAAEFAVLGGFQFGAELLQSIVCRCGRTVPRGGVG